MAQSLLHYSSEPVERVHSVEQRVRPHFKPRGLWVSVEESADPEPQSWREFCERSEWRLDALACVHEVALVPDAHILRISGALDLDAFTEAYKSLDLPLYRPDIIEWSRVATKYQGIIISPYIWSRRLHDEYQWYYSWDVASGCIWDAAAVEGIRLRSLAEPTP